MEQLHLGLLYNKRFAKYIFKVSPALIPLFFVHFTANTYEIISQMMIIQKYAISTYCFDSFVYIKFGGRIGSILGRLKFLSIFL